MARECIYGAARDMVYTDAGPRRAKLLCSAAPATTRAYCWTGIGTMIGTLHVTDRQRRVACERAATTHYRACVAGAGAD
jgi:hypothetical protein